MGVHVTSRNTSSPQIDQLPPWSTTLRGVFEAPFRIRCRHAIRGCAEGCIVLFAVTGDGYYVAQATACDDEERTAAIERLWAKLDKVDPLRAALTVSD